MTRTVFRSCNLCEAACGLAFEVEGERIASIRPDPDDVLSKGFICPKGVAIGEIHHDPDRLQGPMRRTESGGYEPVSWEEAMATTVRRLSEIRARYGDDAVAIYYGNPIVHNHGALLLRAGLLEALGTRNAYSAGSQDTSPRFAASYYLYGNSLVLPVPDVDRTDYFLCIGANPYVSNGSAIAAPNMRGRMRAIRQRGGKVVVVDPRRSETAREADEHVAIRPGGDAAFLLAMVGVLLERGRIRRDELERCSGWAEIEAAVRQLDRAAVAGFTGVPAETIERLAMEFADAPTAAAYSRIGVCNNRFGTLASYATDLLNVAAGRLGKVGGSMFPTPALDATFVTRLPGNDGHDRWRSRVRGLPEVLGDLPAACMAEEIETPGEGQIRALITFAGNPVLSTPNGRRLAKAIEKLEFMVSIDLYVNETTRHADFILPSSWSLTEDHVDLLLPAVSSRNFARWSPPVFAPKDGERADWEILLELTERLGGGPTGTPWLDRLLGIAKRFGYRWNPTATADLLLRLGPHGDRFLPWSRGLNMKKVKEAPHGIDLGPLREGVRVFHRDKKIHLAAQPVLQSIAELAREAARPRQPGELLLIGRRELRTNNSWMHNAPSLVSGRERCVLYVHPEDAAAAGVGDGEVVDMESRVYRGPVRIHVTDEMARGVVSLPHGWGHAASAPWQSVAGAHPGVSANDWTDDQLVESFVGQSILNGVPVRLHRSESTANAA
jgi:anaerobic selenocysteine-containing dehydrogenase